MGSILAKFLAGAAAGLAAWALMEPSAPRMDDPAWGMWERNLILLFGAMVGLVVGGYDGYTRGGKVNLARGLGLGLVFGAVGGMFGYGVGGGIVARTFGPAILLTGGLAAQIIARTIVFIPLGAFLGAAIGASSLTLKRTIQGAIGGAIGGGIGGLSFDLIGMVMGQLILQLRGQTHGEVGGPSRAVTFTVMGAAIALFIGLVERYTRSAWVRLNLGRNEGKEWSIDGPQTFIGRSEGISVPLLGDPSVAPIHAVIQRNGQQYFLTDGGSQIGTYLNGQRIQQAPLAPGSIIQIGSFALQFLIKGTPAPVLPPEAYRGQAYPVGHATAPFAPVTAVAPIAPVAPVASSFAVVTLDGPMAGQRFPVTGAVEIGREGAGIRLATDPNASRRHATFSPTFSGVIVNDMGSTNGTFLNGQRIQTAEAHVGDVIKVGSTNFRVEAS